eukprot:c25876_g1_i1.p1 GENE.c25876_g1_i1~~c25876_g1_i1.p1  ORF type:complete len:850 (+),score=203.37 c25876_g1_i1:28-2550(+)
MLLRWFALVLLIGLAVCDPLLQRHSRYAHALHPVVAVQDKHRLSRELEQPIPFLSSLMAQLVANTISYASDTLQSELQDTLQQTVEMYISQRAMRAQTCIQLYFYKVIDKSVVLLVESVLGVLAAVAAPVSLAFTLPSVLTKISELVVTMPHLLKAFTSAEAVRGQCDDALTLLFSASEHHEDRKVAFKDLSAIQDLRNKVINDGLLDLMSHVQHMKDSFDSFSGQSAMFMRRLDALVRIIENYVEQYTQRGNPKTVQCLLRVLRPLQQERTRIVATITLAENSVLDILETKTTPSLTLKEVLRVGIPTVASKVTAAWTSVSTLCSLPVDGLRKVIDILEDIHDHPCSIKADAVLFGEEGHSRADAREILEDFIDDFSRAKKRLNDELRERAILFRGLHVRLLQKSIDKYETMLSSVQSIISEHEEALDDLSSKLGQLAKNTREQLETMSEKTDMSENTTYQFLLKFLEALDELRHTCEDLATKYLGAGVVDALGLTLDPSLLEEQQATTDALENMFADALTFVEHGAESPGLVVIPENRWDGECGYAYSRARTTHVIVTGEYSVWNGEKSGSTYSETRCDGAAVFTPNDRGLLISTVADLCNTYTVPDPEISVTFYDADEVPYRLRKSAENIRPEHRLYDAIRRQQSERLAEFSAAALQCYALGGFGIPEFTVTDTPGDEDHPLSSYTHSMNFAGAYGYRWYVLGVMPVPQSSREPAVIPGCFGLRKGESCVWVLSVDVSSLHMRRFVDLELADDPLQVVDRSQSKLRHEVLSVMVKREHLVAWVCAINNRLEEQSGWVTSVKRRAVAQEFIDEYCGKEHEDDESFEAQLKAAIGSLGF